jgi:hypothetical protein
MESIADVISYVKYGRTALLEAIKGLSRRQLTQIPIYDEWTVKDVLAHIIGWDHWVIKIVPLIVQDKADQVPEVDVEARNRQFVAAWRERSLTEILAELASTHQQIIDILSSIDFTEIDRRHNRHGRVITIRGYVIEIMVEHERRHAAEIELWRQDLEQEIDPIAIEAMLKQNRDNFMNLLDRFSQADLLNKTAVGSWSLNDLIGHIADWEQRMLDTAYHIYDPSQPLPPPVGDPAADWNEILAAQRDEKSWPENYQDLKQTQQALDDLIKTLRPGDWKLRGLYPWPDDQGTLAELIYQIAEHYLDHLPDLERWYARKPHASDP